MQPPGKQEKKATTTMSDDESSVTGVRKLSAISTIDLSVRPSVLAVVNQQLPFEVERLFPQF